MELDGKPCAAIGQSGLMALYDSLFSQVFIYLMTIFTIYGGRLRSLGAMRINV